MSDNLKEIEARIRALEAQKERILKPIEEAAKAFNGFGLVLAKNLEPLVKQVAQAAEILYKAAMDQYRKEGAIYGESHEGLIRWIKEKRKIDELEFEAARLRAIHRIAQSFKK